MENNQQVALKKHNNKHKRKQEEEAEANPEPEIVSESKNEKKKKKKQRQSPEDSETFNGSVEKSEKKKKRDKSKSAEEAITVETNLENGSAETFNGSMEKSEKKKKKNKSKGAEEEMVVETNLENGSAAGKSEGTVAVSGKGADDTKYKPLQSFSQSGLGENVLECCKNFDKPSPIQSHSWPFLLDGRDLIGIAATGSGKTLAFGIPAIVHVLNKRKSMALKKVTPLCLVLSPTRELAQQIAEVLFDAGKPNGVKSVCVYGGTSKGPQISALKSGVDIVIGTPGRLRDLMEMGVCQLGEVSFVVLDEADRMLDMGFEPEVRAILSQTCSARQMVMFSATWPLPVHQLAQEFMDPHPIKVVVGSEDLAANHDVMQIVEVVEDRARDERLTALLEKYHKSRKNRVLVFVLYKKEASRVESMLVRRGWKAVSISGDKAQNARNEALARFKDGSCPLLIATDVAARGLDIPDVEVVINYSFPLTTEDYVHRIGRTGRAGKKGVAHTFFTKENKALSGELINVLREAGQVVPTALLNFGTHVKKKESKLYGAHFREIGADAPKATKIKFGDSDDE